MRKILLYILPLIAALSMCRCSCSHDGSASRTPEVLGDVLASYTPNEDYQRHGGPMPDDGCEKLESRSIGLFYNVFNDTNGMHLEAAEQLGVQPISSLRQAWHLRRPIMLVASCEDFFVDTLTHSYPYLVPEAAELLHEIGHRFNEKLWARGGGQYRIRVTSLMRTPTTVGKLRRINRNATATSSHQYGTTFDLSQFKFIYDGAAPGHPNRTAEDLRSLLAEVLDEMRSEGRCYVKFERRQACFHITARP